MLAGLEEWAASPEAFAACVIGGRGGTGKTRLGVALCESAGRRGWLSGLLARSAEQEPVEELAAAPTPRLVVVDYAESRPEQLEPEGPPDLRRRLMADPVLGGQAPG